MANILIKKERKVLCNSCNNQTPYIVKKRKLFGEFEHTYAECDNCKYKKTIYYTNKKLRSLFKKQSKETDVNKKKLLTEKIEKETEALIRKFEK